MIDNKFIFDRNYVAEAMAEKKSAVESELRNVVNLSEWGVFPGSSFDGTPPARSWLIEDKIPLGKPILVASAGGIGKTFVLLSLALAVASYRKGGGDRWTSFGKLKTGGAAVVVCAEDDKDEIHRRINSMDCNLPDRGRLFIVPLPNAGGVNHLFGIDPVTGNATTTPFFESLRLQFKEITDLSLIVFDPLQALCGALNLNDPEACQFVAGTMAALAVETGATVIMTHHMRKSGEIKTIDEARDAIRGSGGLVDGVRGAFAIWPDLSGEANSACKALSEVWQPNKVCKLALVKSNYGGDQSVSTLVRNNFGVLQDRTSDIRGISPSRADVEAKFIEAVEQAVLDGRPFTRTGEKGVFKRRHELPAYYREMSKNKLDGLAQDCLNKGLLQTFSDSKNPRAGGLFLCRSNGGFQ